MSEKRFITYFDFLGYKEFILNNPLNYCHNRVSHILRDIEFSLSENKSKPSDVHGGLVLADMSDSTIQSLLISDTVLFWTKDDSVESLQELLRVSYNFNWKVNQINMPIRGAMVYDEIAFRYGSTKNEKDGSYIVNAVYGKGLVKAHMKAENCSWAGCVIDNSVIEYIDSKSNIEELLEKITIKYQVPYKKPPEPIEDEYVFRLVSPRPDEKAYKNFSDSITRCFKNDNKNIDSLRVEEILGNTLQYLKECFKN